MLLICILGVRTCCAAGLHSVRPSSGAWLPAPAALRLLSTAGNRRRRELRQLHGIRRDKAVAKKVCKSKRVVDRKRRCTSLRSHQLRTISRGNEGDTGCNSYRRLKTGRRGLKDVEYPGTKSNGLNTASILLLCGRTLTVGDNIDEVLFAWLESYGKPDVRILR